jgi:hypothetical protein
VCVWKVRRFKCVDFDGVCLESLEGKLLFYAKHSCSNQIFIVPLLV